MMPFLDPDEIGKNAQASAVMAGKLVSTSIKGYIEDKQLFIRESTLSSKFDMRMIQTAKEKGFETTLVFVSVGDADTAVDRVRMRHAMGGHSVPEDDIKRRFERGLENLPEAIKHVDKAKILDNSGDKYKEVATFEKGKMVEHKYTPKWFVKTLEALKKQERQQQMQSEPTKAKKTPERER